MCIRDRRPSYQTVSKEQQKKALNFLLNELKDLSWLDANETLKEFPIRTSVAMQMENAIIDVYKRQGLDYPYSRSFAVSLKMSL